MKKIWGFIKGWRLDKFFNNIFRKEDDSNAAEAQKAADELQAKIEKSSLLVENIKRWLNDPVGDIITAVIPGDWDDKLKATAAEFIGKVSTNSALVAGCFDDKSTIGEQLACVYQKILSVNDTSEVRSFWLKLGTLAAEVFADGKLTFSDAVKAGHFVYEFIIKKKHEG